jgi:hypothetical protein
MIEPQVGEYVEHKVDWRQRYIGQIVEVITPTHVNIEWIFGDVQPLDFLGGKDCCRVINRGEHVQYLNRLDYVQTKKHLVIQGIEAPDAYIEAHELGGHGGQDGEATTG